MRNSKLTFMMFAFVTVFFSLMLYLSPAYAKDVDIWFDNKYDFKNVKVLNIVPVEFDVNRNVKTSEVDEHKINDYNRVAAVKAGYETVNERQIAPTNVLTFYSNIELWDTAEVWNEPYTSWETRYHTRVYRDRDGKEYYENVPYEVPVYHPGYYSYYSLVQVCYELRDADGNAVYIHKEMRNRSDYKAHYNMYERITKDFFTKLKNHIKDVKKAEEREKKLAKTRKLETKSVSTSTSEVAE